MKEDTGHSPGGPGQITLSIEEAARRCDVAPEKMRQWLEAHGRGAEETHGDAGVSRIDLAGLLARHAMPIPDNVLPLQSRKLLFLFPVPLLAGAFATFLDHFFARLRRESGCLVECDVYGRHIRLRLLRLQPDLVVLDSEGETAEALTVAELVRGAAEFEHMKLAVLVTEARKSLPDIRALAALADRVLPRQLELGVLARELRDIFTR